MKRFLLIAILIFPVLTLAVWVYKGFHERRPLPIGTTVTSTNSPTLKTNEPPSK